MKDLQIFYTAPVNLGILLQMIPDISEHRTSLPRGTLMYFSVHYILIYHYWSLIAENDWKKLFRVAKGFRNIYDSVRNLNMIKNSIQ